MTPDPYMAGGATKGSVNNPGDPGSWNRYAYTRGDPVNRADPSGTCDLQISFWGDDAFYTNCDPSLGLDFNPSAYAQCMATPGCYTPLPEGGNPSLAAAQYFPALSASQRQTYNNAVDSAMQDINNMGPQCDTALAGYGIPSLSSVISSSQVGASVFNGQGSGYPQPQGNGTTVGQFFAANQASVAAEVINFGVANASLNVEFLGPAFYNPGLAGVPNANYLQAQAFMVLHEAIHLVTGVGDTAFGGSNGSKLLTNLLVKNCFPVLGLPGALGGLTSQ
jgi:hypothetical protein